MINRNTYRIIPETVITQIVCHIMQKNNFKLHVIKKKYNIGNQIKYQLFESQQQELEKINSQFIQ